MITSRTLEFEDIDVLYGIAELKKVPFVRSQSGIVRTVSKRWLAHE